MIVTCALGLFVLLKIVENIFKNNRSLSNIKVDRILFGKFNEILRSNRQSITLPAVLVDLESFDKNIQLIRDQLTSSPRTSVRIATKSIRVPCLLRRILDSGSPFKGLMCYTVKEAEFLSTLGFDDFLIAYPTQQLCDYIVLKELHENQRKRVMIVVDNLKSIEDLHEFMVDLHWPLPVILEFDASFRLFAGLIHFGARRSPIRTIDQLISTIESMKRLSNVQLVGLMVYESHIAGVADHNPSNGYLNVFIRLVKYFSIGKVKMLRKDLHEICLKYDLKVFNGGGTGSFLTSLEENSVLTEVTIGSGFFQPHSFDHYRQNEILTTKSGSTFQPSCYFALPIVRTSDPGLYVTCAGGGYVASGRSGWDKQPLPVFPFGLRLDDYEAAGEVQTPLKIDPNYRKEIAELLEHNPIVYFRHAKGGELAEHFNEFFLIKGQSLLESGRTYRGHAKCFL